MTRPDAEEIHVAVINDVAVRLPKLTPEQQSAADALFRERDAHFAKQPPGAMFKALENTLKASAYVREYQEGVAVHLDFSQLGAVVMLVEAEEVRRRFGDWFMKDHPEPLGREPVTRELNFLHFRERAYSLLLEKLPEHFRDMVSLAWAQTVEEIRDGAYPPNNAVIEDPTHPTKPFPVRRGRGGRPQRSALEILQVHFEAMRIRSVARQRGVKVTRETVEHDVAATLNKASDTVHEILKPRRKRRGGKPRN
jgi:hypothetical protein